MSKSRKYTSNHEGNIQKDGPSFNDKERDLFVPGTLFDFEHHKKLLLIKENILSVVNEDSIKKVNSNYFLRLLNKSIYRMEMIQFKRQTSDRKLVRKEAKIIHSLASDLLQRINDYRNPVRAIILIDENNLSSKERSFDDEKFDVKLTILLNDLKKRLKPELSRKLPSGRPSSDYPKGYIKLLEKMTCILLDIDRIPSNFHISGSKKEVTTKSSHLFLQLGQALDPSLTAAQVRTYLRRRRTKNPSKMPPSR